jgi:hypothetical protein
LKAVEEIHPVKYLDHLLQLNLLLVLFNGVNPLLEASRNTSGLSYLKLIEKKPGFLINFNVPLIKTASKESFYNLGVIPCQPSLTSTNPRLQRGTAGFVAD